MGQKSVKSSVFSLLSRHYLGELNITNNNTTKIIPYIIFSPFLSEQLQFYFLYCSNSLIPLQQNFSLFYNIFLSALYTKRDILIFYSGRTSLFFIKLYYFFCLCFLKYTSAKIKNSDPAAIPTYAMICVVSPVFTSLLGLDGSDGAEAPGFFP